MSFIGTSCSLDKQFLFPDKIPNQTRKGKAVDQNNNPLSITINTPDYQPVFRNSDSVIIDFDCITESLVFDSENGNKLNVWLMQPKNKKADITLLILHGNSGNIYTNYSIYLPLIEQGFQLAILDYSGFGFSTGEATRKNTLQDARSYLDFMLKHPKVVNTQKVLYGQSYGGHLAIVIGAEYQHILKAIVTDGAFSSPKAIAAYESGLGFVAKIATKTEFSALKSISHISIPLLIVHSVDDTVIPYHMAEDLYKNAKNADLLKTDGCHTCTPGLHTLRLANAIRNILHKKENTQ